jgi:hypothetical protein
LFHPSPINEALNGQRDIGSHRLKSTGLRHYKEDFSPWANLDGLDLGDASSLGDCASLYHLQRGSISPGSVEPQPFIEAGFGEVGATCVVVVDIVSGIVFNLLSTMCSLVLT